MPSGKAKSSRSTRRSCKSKYLPSRANAHKIKAFRILHGRLADALFSASIFDALPNVNEARGLMQSAAATMGEISRPVAGSTARGAVATEDAVDRGPLN